MFKITFEYPHTGAARTFKGLTQREVNMLITHQSLLQDREGEVDIKITVEAE